MVAAGLRCIVSNQDAWYLDHLDTTWQNFYLNEPLTNITDPKKQALILGGEVCMWGEHIDASDIEQTIWPRAAAAAGTSFETFCCYIFNARLFHSNIVYFTLLLP